MNDLDAMYRVKKVIDAQRNRIEKEPFTQDQKEVIIALDLIADKWHELMGA